MRPKKMPRMPQRGRRRKGRGRDGHQTDLDHQTGQVGRPRPRPRPRPAAAAAAAAEAEAEAAPHLAAASCEVGRDPCRDLLFVRDLCFVGGFCGFCGLRLLRGACRWLGLVGGVFPLTGREFGFGFGFGFGSGRGNKKEVCCSYSS